MNIFTSRIGHIHKLLRIYYDHSNFIVSALPTLLQFPFLDARFIMTPPVIVLMAGSGVIILLSVASVVMSAAPCRGATRCANDKNVWLNDLRGVHGSRLRDRGIGHRNRSYAIETQPVPTCSHWLQRQRASVYPANVDTAYVPAGPKYTGGLYNATRDRVWNCRLPRYESSAFDACSVRRDDRHGSTDSLYRL